MFNKWSIGRGNKGLAVEIGNLILYFSYDTLVAFKSPENGLVCCDNIWGSTTGNHLNSIEPDHDKRYDYPSFMAKVEELKVFLDGCGL